MGQEKRKSLALRDFRRGVPSARRNCEKRDRARAARHEEALFDFANLTRTKGARRRGCSTGIKPVARPAARQRLRVRCTSCRSLRRAAALLRRALKMRTRPDCPPGGAYCSRASACAGSDSPEPRSLEERALLPCRSGPFRSFMSAIFAPERLPSATFATLHGHPPSRSSARRGAGRPVRGNCCAPPRPFLRCCSASAPSPTASSTPWPTWQRHG